MAVDETKAIGKRIGLAREARGLSVADLADKAGCSEEYLEWVEEGQVHSPVALLIRLARALKMDSGAFMHPESPSRRRLEAHKRTEHYSYKTLTPAEEDSHLMAFSITIPAKTAHKGVGYKHEGEEFVYVLSGEVLVTVEGRKKKLTRRQSMRFNSNLDHHLSNPGTRKAELLVVLYLP
jgi:transcriptional regulator with XRE-family HTH domain